MVHIDALQFSYHNKGFGLDIPELAADKCDKLAMIGPSGTGKTTLLNLIAGIVTPQAGTIDVDETRVNELSDDARRDFRITHIGFVFQD